MATKSILKNVNIKGHRKVLQLANALEHAEGKTAKPVALRRTFSEIRAEDICKVFGGTK